MTRLNLAKSLLVGEDGELVRDAARSQAAAVFCL